MCLRKLVQQQVLLSNSFYVCVDIRNYVPIVCLGFRLRVDTVGSSALSLLLVIAWSTWLAPLNLRVTKESCTLYEESASERSAGYCQFTFLYGRT